MSSSIARPAYAIHADPWFHHLCLPGRQSEEAISAQIPSAQNISGCQRRHSWLSCSTSACWQTRMLMQRFCFEGATPLSAGHLHASQVYLLQALSSRLAMAVTQSWQRRLPRVPALADLDCFVLMATVRSSLPLAERSRQLRWNQRLV